MDTRRDGSPLLESSVEGYLDKQMKKIGGRTYKFPPAVKGNPDRIVLFPYGRIFLVELKRKGETPSPAQRLWHDRAYQMGHVVHVIDSREMVDAFIAWAVKQRETIWTEGVQRHEELTAMENGYKEET